MESKPVVRPVALVGLMGAGKSEVARALGERLGASVADLDAMIEAVEGASVADLFQSAGEAWFRRRESELLAQAVVSGVRVIACGGGIVLDESRRAQLREHCDVVWLQVSPGEAARRLGSQPHLRRPLLADGTPEARLAALLEARAPLYSEVATHRVNTDGRSPGEVAVEIASWLAARA